MSSSNPRCMIRCASGLIFAVVLVGMVGCNESATNAADGKTAQVDSKARSSRADATEGRGNARFTTAGTTWNSTRASARIKNGRLRISASKTDKDGDTRQSDRLNLNISDVKGPGRYKPSGMSMFIRVDMKVSEKSDEPVDAKKTLMDALENTTQIPLWNADVEIVSISDEYIDGTFSIDKPDGTPESTITDGQFHARIRK